MVQVTCHLVSSSNIKLSSNLENKTTSILCLSTQSSTRRSSRSSRSDLDLNPDPNLSARPISFMNKKKDYFYFRVEEVLENKNPAQKHWNVSTCLLAIQFVHYFFVFYFRAALFARLWCHLQHPNTKSSISDPKMFKTTEHLSVLYLTKIEQLHKSWSKKHIPQTWRNQGLREPCLDSLVSH